MKSITKSITKHDSNNTLSTISRLYIARYSRDSAACLSNLACQQIMFLNTLLGYTLLDYIEYSKDLVLSILIIFLVSIILLISIALLVLIAFLVLITLLILIILLISIALFNSIIIIYFLTLFKTLSLKI